MQAHKRGSNALADRPTSIYADVYPDPVTRGRALTIFMTVSNTHCIQPHKIEEDAGSRNPQYLRACQLQPHLLSLVDNVHELKRPQERGHTALNMRGKHSWPSALVCRLEPRDVHDWSPCQLEMLSLSLPVSSLHVY